MAKKVIIIAAVTGGIHTPSMSPYLPVTPEMIVEDAVGAHAAGAAVVHIHARSAEDGRPTPDLNVMREIVTAIKQRCEVAICITSGGAPGMTLDERLAPIAVFKPELASCNAGSLNFTFANAAESIKNPQYEWEIPYLKKSDDAVFTNTFKGLGHYIQTMNQVGTVPEFEIYDVGMINNIAYFAKRGIVKRPVYLQFVLGITGGIPATVDNLSFLVKTAREQFGDCIWSCAGVGRHQFMLGPAAMAMGGNVRVGLEDNLFLRPGVFAKSSAEQVIQMREIAERMGIEIASTGEARVALGLKGRTNVDY
jgi:uncharacterized protein (DUF849 family)